MTMTVTATPRPTLSARLLLAAALALAAPLTQAIDIIDENARPGSAYSHDGAPQAWLVAASADWMAALPDTTPLAALSIPGTHDSGARHGGLAVQTQSWTIGAQLDAGVRYLDIRLRRIGGAFTIHHGAFYQHANFDDVMRSVTDFLRRHPGETVLMRVGEEYHAESGSEAFDTIWKRYAERYRDAIHRSDDGRMPRLGEVRGKIVMLRDDAKIPVADGLAYRDQKRQDVYNVYFFQHAMHDGDKASLPSKKDLVKDYIRAAGGSGDDTLVLNHLSGSGGMAPSDVARAVNTETFGFLANTEAPRRLGVLIMDFPGDRLVYRIIRSNIRHPGACGAKAFRSQSAHSWVEFRLPAGRAPGDVIEIPSGAHNKYQFPKCNRVRWSNLSFLCTAQQQWVRSTGDWDADGQCTGSPGNSPFVATGTR